MGNRNRSVRYLGRSQLNRVSQVKACRECGRSTINSGGLVGIRATGELGVGSGITSGYAGLSTCGRIWLCPVCNSKVMAHRAVEIGAVLAWAAAEGYLTIWGSLTCRHRVGTPLRSLIDIQRGAWRRVMQSKLWTQWAESKGGDRIGYIRASEITIGAHGWHPHFHPIVIVKGDRLRAEWFAAELVKLWVDAVGAEGGDAMGANGAQKLDVLEGADAAFGLHEYVVKSQYTPQGLALEAVWSQSKTDSLRKPRVQSTLPHWSLLDAAAQGLAIEALNWWEFEEATEGHRMITWSRDLRKLAGLGEEIDDETLASRELGSIDDTVCFITPEGWRVARDTPALVTGILDALEEGGWLELRGFLDLHGVEWVSMDDVGMGGAGVSQLVEKLGKRPDDVPGGYRSTYVDPDLFSEFFDLAEEA